jgi:hypothetical protein
VGPDRLKASGCSWMDEKRAFTLLVSVAADGTILPFQGIFQGKTKLSLPAASSPNYADAMKAGFKFEFSGTKTYWSNQETMCAFVNDLISMKEKSSSGFQSCRRASGKLTSGRSTVLRNFWIGCASNIQISLSTSCQEAAQEFTNPVMLGFSAHSNYRQGNLTMKILSTIFLKELDKGNPMPHLNDSLGVIRNQSVRWMWNVCRALNNKELVKKVCQCLNQNKVLPFFRCLKAALYVIGIYCIPV